MTSSASSSSSQPTRPHLSLEDMRASQRRLEGKIVLTPSIDFPNRAACPELSDMASVRLKLELFQHTGTFKARGALHAAMAIPESARSRGITAASAGNHAIAAAFAGASLGLPTKVFVQASASPVRVAAARRLGADIELVADGATAFAMAQKLAQDEGRTMLHPFEGPMTSLGTATLGLELMDQSPDADAVIVSIGGGGLASGVAAAIKALSPSTAVYGVEPEGANVMQRSLVAGSPQTLSSISTIADSLAPPMTLPFAFGLCQQHLDDVVTVSDDALCQAMRILFQEAKLAVEPAGAAALAAAMGPLRQRLQGKRVVLIVCGANIDPDTFGQYLSRGSQT